MKCFYPMMKKMKSQERLVYNYMNINGLDIIKVYNDVFKHNTKKTTALCIHSLLYLYYHNIELSEYVEQNSTLSKMTPSNFVKNPILKNDEKVIFDKIKPSFPPPSKSYYPLFFFQGYIACYYYIEANPNNSLLYNYIRNIFLIQNSSIKKKKTAGCITYFKSNMNLEEIYPYYEKVTKRKRLNKSKYAIDIVSIFLLCFFNKKSIWDITSDELFEVYNMIKKDFKGLNKQLALSDKFFNISVYFFIQYWWALYAHNRKITPPPNENTNIVEKNLSESNQKELYYYLNLIPYDNNKIKSLIVDVFNKFKMEYGKDYLFEVISAFAHLYAFCIEKKLQFESSESILTFIKSKCEFKNKKYRNTLVKYLKTFFKLTIRLGYFCNPNPVKNSFSVRTSRFANLPDEKIIPPQDIKKIMAVLDKVSEFERLFILLLYHTGLRIGEALKLTVGCIVKITEDTVIVYVPTHKKREEPYFIKLRNKEIIDVVAKLIILRSSFDEVPHYKTKQLGHWLLVYSYYNRQIHMTPQKGNKIIKKICKLANVKDYTNHCFRHTFAHERLNIDKINMWDISQMLGHYSPDSLIVYTKLTTEEKLIFFSRMFNRRDAVNNAIAKAKLLQIEVCDTKYTINKTNRCTTWCGTGWCDNDSLTSCPKRKRSCYTCILYKPDIDKINEIKADYIANRHLLEEELKQEYPIRKEVMYFYNLLIGIAKNLGKLGFDISNLDIQHNDILKRTSDFINVN